MTFRNLQGADRSIGWDELERFQSVPLCVTFTEAGAAEPVSKVLDLERLDLEAGQSFWRLADARINSPGAQGLRMPTCGLRGTCFRRRTSSECPRVADVVRTRKLPRAVQQGRLSTFDAARRSSCEQGWWHAGKGRRLSQKARKALWTLSRECIDSIRIHVDF